MDVYYTREGAIPACEAARLIGARSKDEREALAAVLSEFFVLVDGAYVQDRCDREIERYRQTEPEREAKRANERERQARARARRKELFDALRAAGVVPAYDTPMSELQALASRHLSRVTERDVTPPVTSDATATHTHTQLNTPPIPPKGAKAAVTLKTWINEAKTKGEQPIPAGDAVFAYAEEVGLPDEYLALAWQEFRHRYSQPDAKRYRDWRAVFRKAVRGNWLKLWYFDSGRNEYGLTTQGHQAIRAKDERKAA